MKRALHPSYSNAVDGCVMCFPLLAISRCVKGMAEWYKNSRGQIARRWLFLDLCGFMV